MIFDKKIISASEAKYKIEDDTITTSGGAQASYNLEQEFFDYIINHNILNNEPKTYTRTKGDSEVIVHDYLLNEKDYTFELGPGVLWLINDDFKDTNNKFIASIGIPTDEHKRNMKPQLYKTSYRRYGKGYEWFLDLYAKNLVGNKLVFDIDEENKILTLDIKFNAIETTVSEEDIQPDEANYDSEISYNKIYFGAPGTGKSYNLDKERKELLGDNDNHFERVTFHPDYSYGDFVGTYKPFVEKNEENKDEITYKFIPGSFLRVLIKALKDPEHLYMLIIEEINRADVYSVFGDVFQLLDRDKDNESVYSIDISEDVKKYFKDHKIELEKLEIPRNMLIWATMNSADQGVFPVDTAFKRRWDFEYLSLDNNQEENTGYIHTKTGDYEWNDIRTTINNYLLKEGINEDKCMGPFFINNESNDDYTEMFKNKVLMYLFEDAARPLRQRIFSDYDVLTFSNIITDFNGEKGMHIFNDEIVSVISKDSDSDDDDINDTQ